MQSQKPLLTQVLEYIAKPSIEGESSLPWYKIIFNILRLWSISFSLAVFFALVTNALLFLTGHTEENLKILEFVEDIPPLFIFFLVVVWAPITEEIGFRLWLRFSPFKWALGIAFFSFFFASFVFDDIFNFYSLESGFVSSLLILIIFASVFFTLRDKDTGIFVKKFFEKHFHIFFYALTLLFAFIHIANYDVDFRKIWYFAPLLIFPQLFLSFLISFVRMRYGFFWAVLTHALNNAVAIVPLLLISPLLENEFFNAENLDSNIFEVFSSQEIFLLIIYIFFLFFLMMFVLGSIFSLFLEFTKFKK